MKNFELNHLLSSGAFGRDDSYGRRLRGESSDWLVEALDRIYTGRDADEDVKATASVTAGHSVESFVEDLKKRVQLSALEKIASSSARIPLYKSAKAAEPLANKVSDKLKEMALYLVTNHLKPTHAMIGAEALFNELKEKFDSEEVQKIGRDKIMEMIVGLQSRHAEPNLADGLPVYDGSPIPARSQEEQSAPQAGKAKV